MIPRQGYDYPTTQEVMRGGHQRGSGFATSVGVDLEDRTLPESSNMEPYANPPGACPKCRCRIVYIDRYVVGEPLQDSNGRYSIPNMTLGENRGHLVVKCRLCGFERLMECADKSETTKVVFTEGPTRKSNHG